MTKLGRIFFIFLAVVWILIVVRSLSCMAFGDNPVRAAQVIFFIFQNISAIGSLVIGFVCFNMIDENNKFISEMEKTTIEAKPYQPKTKTIRY